MLTNLPIAHPPSRGLLRDCKTSHNLREGLFKALLASAAAVSSADLDVTLSLQVRAVLQFVKPFVCGGSGAHFLILSYSIVANSGLANSRVGRVSLCKSAVRVTWCYASSQQQGY